MHERISTLISALRIWYGDLSTLQYVGNIIWVLFDKLQTYENVENNLFTIINMIILV